MKMIFTLLPKKLSNFFMKRIIYSLIFTFSVSWWYFGTEEVHFIAQLVEELKPVGFLNFLFIYELYVDFIRRMCKHQMPHHTQ